LTVGPGTYHARLKFAETQYSGANQRGITIYINGEMVQSALDVAGTAGEADAAADLVFNEIHPKNGAIAIRLVGSKVEGCQREAMLQALEIGPGDSEPASTAKTLTAVSPSGGSDHEFIYIQAVRYKDSITPERAQQLLESLKTAFKAIPQIKSIEVGRVVEDNTKNYDFAVILTFDSLEDKKNYGNSEVHRRWVKENVGDIIEKHLMLTIQQDHFRQ
jgi:hypothetical protein